MAAEQTSSCAQYASFQDKHHLYFLFDLLPGGDLMDILVAEAQVITHRLNDGYMQLACLSSKTKILKVRTPPPPVALLHIKMPTLRTLQCCIRTCSVQEIDT